MAFQEDPNYEDFLRPLAGVAPTALSFRGTWDPTRQYQVNDLVYWEGTTYWAPTAIQGVNPLTVGVPWVVYFQIPITALWDDAISFWDNPSEGWA